MENHGLSQPLTLHLLSTHLPLRQLQGQKQYPESSPPRNQDNKNKKGKKGGKKDTKKEDGNQEEIRKQEEEQQRKKEEEWNKLSPEDLKYRDFQDSFRAPQLKFENSDKTQTISGKSLVIFQERVLKDGGEWVYVVKEPSATEDQLAKMRKAKPKTLANVNDLNPVVMRCWLDYSSLNSINQTSITQRCPLVQIDKTAETSEPNLENTYIKIKLVLGESLLLAEDGLLGQKLIAEPMVEQEVSESVKAVRELQDELKLGVQSLAMQFSGMFMRELNLYEDFKNMNFFLTKKNDVTKRKQHFLYDFNVSGKYKILKDRLKKVIVHLCQHYFTKEMGNAKTFSGVSCNSKDQFYSHIYNFLVAHYKQTLQHLIFQKKQSLRQIEVLSPEAQQRNVTTYLELQLKESQQERAERIVKEYQCLGDYSYGEKLMKGLMEAEPSNADIKYSYAMYCLKNRLKRPDQMLSLVEEYLSHHKDDLQVRLQYLLLLTASESEENGRKAWVLLREAIAANSSDIKNFTLASFIFQDVLGMTQLGEKYLCAAERTQLKVLGKVPEDGKHKQTPAESEIPSTKGLPSFANSLSEDEKDGLWVDVLKMFLNLNLFKVVQKVQNKIKSTDNPVFDLLKLKKLLSDNCFDQFQTQAQQLYEENKSQEVLDLLVSHFLQHPSSSAQKCLKINLTRTTGAQQLQALLKLGFYYLKHQQYANSRSCLLKYLQKVPQNSGWSWRLLGICELKLENLSQSLDAIKKANLADTSNCENWLWMTRIYALKGNYLMCNQCLNQYEKVSGTSCGLEVRSEIRQQLSKGNSEVLCEQKMRIQLVERLTVQETS